MRKCLERDLEVGDLLKQADGELIEVKSIGASETDFIVGTNGIVESVINGQHVLSRHVGNLMLN